MPPIMSTTVTQTVASVDQPPAAGAGAPPTTTRITSIDAFRGFVMFLMLAEVMRLPALHRVFPDSRSGRSWPTTPRTSRGRGVRSTI